MTMYDNYNNDIDGNDGNYDNHGNNGNGGSADGQKNMLLSPVMIRLPQGCDDRMFCDVVIATVGKEFLECGNRFQWDPVVSDLEKGKSTGYKNLALSGHSPE